MQKTRFCFLFYAVLASLALQTAYGRQDVTQQEGAIKDLIAKYAAAVNAEPVDISLASQVWSHSPEVTFINPLGEERGWGQIKREVYQNEMEGLFSERKLVPRDIAVHIYGDSAWAEFNWKFTAKSRQGGAAVETSGVETQIYRKTGPSHWELVHVHYSAAPSANRAQ